MPNTSSRLPVRLPIEPGGNSIWNTFRINDLPVPPTPTKNNMTCHLSSMPTGNIDRPSIAHSRSETSRSNW